MGSPESHRKIVVARVRSMMLDLVGFEEDRRYLSPGNPDASSVQRTKSGCAFVALARACELGRVYNQQNGYAGGERDRILVICTDY